MNVFCNPVNINYRYQFNQDPRTNILTVNREAADPSMILYGGRYYIFASMTLGVWVSDDLAHWENHRLPDTLPLYDYAPDVRVINGYVYLSASKRNENCNYYRTKDILNGPYEEIDGTFPFWDPNLFQDDDGRVYFYWGCASETPVYGVEVDPETMRPIGERRELIFGDAFTKGYERTGVDHCLAPRSEEEIDTMVQGFLSAQGIDASTLPSEVVLMIRGMFSQKPFVEGAWMDKFNGRYYLQYACPGAEFNTYADAVYVSDSPLGPFKLADNNPYSYHPGGFMPGAGHSSTMCDKAGNLWHASTMRISVHHPFERRVGIWPAGFDADGELFCNQRYGDWPMTVGDGALDPWKKPEWFLLSYGKSMSASSFTQDHEPGKAADENAQTWWQADSNQPGEWLALDLGKTYDVRAIQINFADDKIDIPAPGEFRTGDTPRYIDDAPMRTRWRLEGSTDGEIYTLGHFAEKPRYQGGGSSHITSSKVVGALEAARDAGNDVIYAPGCEPDGSSNERLLVEAVKAAGNADAAIVFVGLTEAMESEGVDRAHMDLPEGHNALVEAVCAANPNTVVVLHGGSPVVLPWTDKPRAILNAYLGGQAVGEAVLDVLYGDVNPSGHLAESYPLRLEDTPGYLTWHGEGTHLPYAERLFVGYRYYESRKMPVRYPFGYGLSYTTFAYSDLTLDKSEIEEGTPITASVTVTNTGKRTGKAVVQLYVAPEKVEMIRPIRELKGFTKVELKPGESRTVTFTLDQRAFAHWNPQVHSWRTESGRYTVQVGENAHDIVLEADVRIHAEPVPPEGGYTLINTMEELARSKKGYAFVDANIDYLMRGLVTIGMMPAQLLEAVPGRIDLAAIDYLAELSGNAASGTGGVQTLLSQPLSILNSFLPEERKEELTVLLDELNA